MKPSESLHRPDMKDVGFEEPAPEVWFDPKRDVTEDDWRLLREPFNIQTSMPMTFTLTECAATMRILDPEKLMPSESFGNPPSAEKLMSPTGFGIPPSMVGYNPVLSFAEAALYHLSNPNWDPLISNEVWDSIIDTVLNPAEYWGPRSLYQSGRKYDDFIYIAAHMHILRPDLDLKITDESWEEIWRAFELERRDKKPSWGSLARFAADIRLVDPRADFHFTESELEGMREELKKRNIRSNVSWVGSIEGYTELLRSIAILSASDVRVTDRGIFCEWKPPAKQPKKSDPFPEVKKY